MIGGCGAIPAKTIELVLAIASKAEAAGDSQRGLFKVNGEILAPAGDERAIKDVRTEYRAALPPDVRKACGFPTRSFDYFLPRLCL
jgi:hypothetical protein